MPEALRAALLAGLLTLAGCTQWHYELGQPIAESAVQRVSNMSQALRLFGPPQRMAAGDAGYVLAWEYWQIRENSVGISLGAVGVDALSVDWGEADISGEFLILGFNRQHRLVDSAFTRFDNSAGGGIALTPVPAGPGLTNVDDLVTRMPQHGWGAQSLQRLPAALNASSEPELSGGVIEQRGTPLGIGQRTLQMD